MKTAEEIILLPSKSESEIVADDLYLTEMTQRLQKLRSLLEKAETGNLLLDPTKFYRLPVSYRQAKVAKQMRKKRQLLATGKRS